MNKLSLFIPGKAVPQPRHRTARKGEKTWAYISKKHKIHPWKAAIKLQLMKEGYANKKIADPVKLKAIFKMTIPKSLKKIVSENTPHIKKIDIDNLLKAVMDVLTQTGVIVDDCLVYEINVSKVYATEPGVYVELAW